MAYFENIRSVIYQFPDNVQRVVNDLSIKPRFRDIVLENTVNFEVYTVNDGDTPETIAFNEYNDVNMHWAIMIANDITSIYTDWPKSQGQFSEYMFQKYKSQTDSDGTAVTLTRDQVTQFIQFKGTSGNDYTGFVDGTSVVLRPKHFIDTDKNIYTYDSIVNNSDAKDAFGRTVTYPTVTPVSIEDDEIAENEAKREIIIPKRRIIDLALKELEESLNG